MYKVAIVGFGQIAESYSEDDLLKKYYQYISHVEVIIDHPELSLFLVVDPSSNRREVAINKYNCPYVFESLSELPDDIRNKVDILILATPPEIRLDAIKVFSKLEAVILEKPLAPTYKSAEQIVDYCNKSDILLQVNFWRRADLLFREIAEKKLNSLVGECLTARVIYGNGLSNNGVHMVDMVRMFLGDIKTGYKLRASCIPHILPIKGDCNQDFMLTTYSGIDIMFYAVNYHYFRENSFEIIGSTGKLEILNEGLTIRCISTSVNRSTQNTLELNYDSPHIFKTTVGNALYHLHQNVLDSLLQSTNLVSSGYSALVTTRIVDYLSRDYPPIHPIDFSS